MARFVLIMSALYYSIWYYCVLSFFHFAFYYSIFPLKFAVAYDGLSSVKTRANNLKLPNIMYTEWSRLAFRHFSANLLTVKKLDSFKIKTWHPVCYRDRAVKCLSLKHMMIKTQQRDMRQSHSRPRQAECTQATSQHFTLGGGAHKPRGCTYFSKKLTTV